MRGRTCSVLCRDKTMLSLSTAGTSLELKARVTLADAGQMRRDARIKFFFISGDAQLSSLQTQHARMEATQPPDRNAQSQSFATLRRAVIGSHSYLSVAPLALYRWDRGLGPPSSPSLPRRNVRRHACLCCAVM